MSYLNMVLTEFLKKISGENDNWQLSIGVESYSLKQTELTDLKEKDIQKLKANGAKITLLERNNNLTEIEILDYLAKITNNFDTQRSQIVLKDIEDFQSRFIVDAEYQSLFIYKVNGWRIPIKSREKIDKCDVETYDYDWMLSPTHGVGIRNIEKVVSVLKNEMEKKETEPQQTPDVNEQPEIFLDYSDNTAAEKIVFLHELGILEFLMKKEPFNTSTNKLAEVISSFTGISQTTAQSYLNPIISNQFDAKNNPLTPKQTKTVTEKLIKMGFIRK